MAVGRQPRARHRGRAVGSPPFVPPEQIPDRPSAVRVFGSAAFFRLWLAQVVLSTGDWVGFVAITALAARVGGGSPEASVGVVLSARLLPGFFLSPMAGVLVDRWNRKNVMVACSLGRGVVLLFLPSIDTVAGLVVASLVLELLNLMWGPAKEASVPRLVPGESLATANSLGLAAAYGTFPLAALLFAALAKVDEWLSGWNLPGFLRLSQETVAIWFYVLTCLIAAVMIATIRLPHHRLRNVPLPPLRPGETIREVMEGWRYIGTSPVVRAVMLGIATGLVGGGMLVPLGPALSQRVLGGGSAGYGLLLTFAGLGTSISVVALLGLHSRLNHERTFVAAGLTAGLCIIGAASMSTLTPAVVFVSLLGVCGGAVYVLGITILQSDVDDQLRGRIFATFYTLVRFCLLLAFAIAPLLASLLDSISSRYLHRRAQIGEWSVSLPGVRLTLWLGGTIILMAGVLAALSFRANNETTNA